MNDDFNETYALITTTEKLKWWLIGFAAGVGACFLIQVLA